MQNSEEDVNTPNITWCVFRVYRRLPYVAYTHCEIAVELFTFGEELAVEGSTQYCHYAADSSFLNPIFSMANIFFIENFEIHTIFC
jgi:hypothetical protein